MLVPIQQIKCSDLDTLRELLSACQGTYQHNHKAVETTLTAYDVARPATNSYSRYVHFSLDHFAEFTSAQYKAIADLVLMITLLHIDTEESEAALYM